MAGALVAPVAGVLPAPEVRAASPTDLTLVTSATYTVNTATRRITVSMAITAQNRTRETKTHRFFFDHAFVAVQPGTTGYRISGDKGARVRVARRKTDSTLLRIDFGRKLYSGRSHAYRLSFEIIGAGRLANPQARVGTGLVTIPVWAFASTGARGSSVTVRFPQGWDVAVEAGTFAHRSTSGDGGVVLESGQLATPLTWFAYISAQRDAVYRDHPLTVQAGGSVLSLILRAWVDDPAWANRTGVLLRTGLPVLQDEIGVAWPHSDPMVVQEAVNRAAGGFAGLFDPAESRIEVAYWADGLVTLHEAAHAWFNGSLLADRWADEGFASLYAARAAEVMKVKGAVPILTDKVRAAAIPLNAWPQAGINATADPATAATEAYGYAASAEAVRAIAARAGDEALTRVWGDAAARVGAYQPPQITIEGTDGSSAPERVDGAPDWRGFLDLLEAQTGRDFTDLWRAWVIRPDEGTLLDARATARTSYTRTLALAGDWMLPRSIRDALRAWQFDAAGQQLADARTVLAQWAALETMAARDQVTLPDSMRPLFEAGSMTQASAGAEALRNAMLTIERAAAARSAESDPLIRIGMLGEQPEADLAKARASLASGELEASAASADDAYRAWAGAWQEGRRRAMLALAAFATVLVIVSALAAAIRRGRRAGRRPPVGDDPVTQP